MSGQVKMFFIVKCTVVSLMSKLVSLKARCIKTVLSGLLMLRVNYL